MTTQPLPSPEQIDAMAEKVMLFEQYHRQAADMLRAIASHLRSHAGDAEDAKRYRWLRNHSSGQFEHPIIAKQKRVDEGMLYIAPLCGVPLDKAIDAALKENSDER